MARPSGAILYFRNGSVQHFNKIFLLTSKLASYCLRVSCDVHQHTVKDKCDDDAQKSSISQISGPLAVLQEKIDNGELMHDDYQKKIADCLQRLYENIEGYRPPVHGLFSNFFQKRTKAPKGLYIYGAVGGGKTMLMDLFYSCCQVHCFVLVLVSTDKV
jgi:predicted ATPase